MNLAWANSSCEVCQTMLFVVSFTRMGTDIRGLHDLKNRNNFSKRYILIIMIILFVNIKIYTFVCIILSSTLLKLNNRNTKNDFLADYLNCIE